MATILTKKSDTASSVPTAGALTNSTGGAEIAVNTADKRLFTKDSGGTVVELGTNPSSLSLPNGTANAVPYLNGSKVLTSGSALTFDGTSLFTTGYVSATNGLIFGSSSNYLYQSAATKATLRIGTTPTYLTFADASGTPTIDGAGGALAFATTTSEQMRLTSTGLGIGTSSPGAKLDVAGGIKSNASVSITKAGSDTIASGPFFYVTSGGAGDGWVTQLGASNTYDWWNNTGGTWTKKATLDSAGNLGLGVTPSAWDTAGKAIQVGQGGSISGDTGTYSSMRVNANAYYNAGWKYILSSQGASRYEQYGGSHAWYTAPSGTAGNAISFTQAMTLDASGNLGIGTSTPGSKLQVNGAITIGQADAGLQWLSGGSALADIRADASSNLIFRNTASYTERMRIDSSGNLLINATSGDNNAKLQLGGTSTTMRFIPTVDNTGYVGQATHRWAAIYAANGTIQTSDGREKNTIENSVLGLDFVKALRPVSFKWNVGENVVTYDEEGNQVVIPRPGTRTHFGFIAQEVKEALGTQDFGGYVEEQDGRLGLRYDQFISPLVKAIQEQQAIINAQQAALDSLKARLDAANL